jgi:outer membrane receptor protein involved in Fe transport
VLNYIYENAHNRPYIGGNHDNQFYSLLYLPANIDQKTLAPGYDSTGREVEYAASISNPYYIINKEKESDTRNRLTGSGTLKYQITNWLYARGRITRDYYLSKRFQYIPDNNVSSSYPEGSLDQRLTESTENNYEFILGAAPADIGKFGINGFVGGNVNWRSYNQNITSGNTFVVPGVYTFNNLANKLPSTSVSERRTNSLFGNIEFSYNKYLYLTLTGRNDWFSTLPLDNNNLFYPATSLSFIFSDALKLPSWVSYGKFRASSAQVSGDTGPYQLDLSYALDPLQFGSLPLQMIGTSNIPNKQLKPQLSTDYEVGLEMGFAHDRIGFDIDYYNKNIKNDIVVTAVPITTGYSTAILNVGKLADNGIELLLRGTPIKTKNFSWDMTLTFSTLNDKVISLGEGTKGANIILTRSKSGNASVQLEEGTTYGGIYGYTYKRDSTGRKIYNSQGLPEYNTDQRRIGNSLYNKILGFSNTFSYKNFSLYVFFDGKFGADIYSETNATAYDEGKHKATLIGREDGLVADGAGEDGKSNTVMVRGYNSPDGPAASISTYYKQIKQVSEQFIYDASFVKLREISLSYNFNPKVLHKIGFTNASVSIIARNLLTVYKNKNLVNVDPESSVSSGNAQGIERLVYPVTRNYGVTLKFGL